MNTTPLRTALALALGLAVGAAAAQDAAKAPPTPQQKQELEAARKALSQAADHYADLAARYGDTDKVLRFERNALRKPVIGVVLATDDDAGVRIAGVTPDSAAAAAGLKSGDRIVSIRGKRIDATDAAARVAQARDLLAALDAKTAVTLGYERAGKPGIVSVTPKVGERVMVVPRTAAFGGDGGRFTIETDRMDGELAPTARIAMAKALSSTVDTRRNGDLAFAIAPDVRREILRLGSDCEGKDCKLPALAEALRWNGLNLAAVDASLGRYFGTDTGVLVLSAGKDLEALQGGDVILKIAGKPVASPRDAMELLRAQPADAKVAVEYLRDRKPGAAQVAVPAPTPFPAFRVSAPAAGDATSVRRIMVIDKDGKTQAWEGGKDDAPPAWVQALPKAVPQGQERVRIVRKEAAAAPASPVQQED